MEKSIDWLCALCAFVGKNAKQKKIQPFKNSHRDHILIDDRIWGLCRNCKQKFNEYDSKAKNLKNGLPGLDVVCRQKRN